MQNRLLYKKRSLKNDRNVEHEGVVDKSQVGCNMNGRWVEEGCEVGTGCNLVG